MTEGICMLKSNKLIQLVVYDNLTHNVLPKNLL
jgi:hypothetical protein